MSRYPVPVEQRLWARVERGSTSECWEWQGAINSHGYGTIRERCKSKGAHVIAYRSTRGEVPSGLYVCHTCDNRRCCNPEHLFLGTNLDNTSDRNAKGRQARGSRISTAKLTEAEVAIIRYLTDCGANGKALAKLYGIDQTAVSAIHRRRTWAHVPDLRISGVTS